MIHRPRDRSAPSRRDLLERPAPRPRTTAPGAPRSRPPAAAPPPSTSPAPPQILDRDGAVLLERAGTVLAPCGNRRAAVCPACSDRYAADAYHLLRAGLAGDDAKGVPDTRHRAPAGVPHPDRTRRSGRCTPATSPAAGTSSPAAAATGTTPPTPASAPPIDPDSYDYNGAVLWQAHAGALWARFTTTLRRALAAALGVRRPRLPRPRPAVLRQGRRVPTPRARALPRRHPPRRPRRTHRPTTRPGSPTTRCATPSPPPPAPPRSPPPGRTAPRSCSAGVPSSTSARSPPPPRAQLEDDDGRDHRRRAGRLHRQVRHQVHRRRRRGEGADRPIRDGDHIAHLDVIPAPPPHDRNRLAARRPAAVRRAEPAPVGAHARLPRPLPHQVPRLLGHLHRHPRSERRTWRLRADLDQLAADTDDPGDIAAATSTPSPSINDW